VIRDNISPMGERELTPVHTSAKGPHIADTIVEARADSGSKCSIERREEEQACEHSCIGVWLVVVIVLGPAECRTLNESAYICIGGVASAEMH
jgi:hypothetical protein